MEKILVQRDLCDGCKDCESACGSIHETSRINIIDYEDSYFPILCQQCEDAPCELICPTEAMEPHSVISEKCIACGLCSLVCPFGAVTVANKTAEKCNHCIDREEGPSCIKACSKRAISLVDSEKLRAQKQEAYISKMTGKNKKAKKNSFINVITSGSRVNSSFQGK